ncbi:uncharacterized protein LOC143246828 [Tachypleus tridentatus]|uniref:uncharacterized protein LOC143246828 n=1 Tax=Tachypleus tridentatus TaxID=6853 RepID=UPI003FD1938C
MKHPSLMDLKQTRQIVVNKYKTKENSRKRTRDKSTLKSSSRRFSPRVSAKKASPHVPKTSPKKEVKQVCRNLFDTTKHFRKYSCPVQVSRKYNQKSEVTTPRGNNVLKTRFVPETPSHRQGPHVVLRKQEHLRSSTLTLLNAVVVEESPDKVLKEAEPLLNQRRPFQGLRRSCSFYDTETSKSRNMEKADASLLAQRIHGCSNVSPHTLFSELCSSPKVCMTSLQDIQMMSSNLKIHRVSSYNHKTPTGNMSTPRTRGTLSRSVLTTPTRKMSSAPRTPEASSSSILKTPSRKMSSAPRTSGASSSILKTPSRKMSSSPRTSGASSSILKTPSRKMSSSPRTSGASSSILKTPSKKPTSSPKTLGTFPSILKTPSKKLSSSPKTPGTSPPILMTLNRKMSSASRTPRVSPSIMKTSLSLWGSPSQNTRSKTPAKQSFSSLKHPSTPTSSTKIQRRILFKDGDSSDSGILSSHSSISPEIKKTPRCFKEGISLDATEIKTHDNEVHCTPKVILTNLNHIHSEDLSLDKEEYKLSELVPVEENIDHGSGEVNKNVKECTFRTNNNKIHEDLSLKFPRFTRGKSKEMGVSSDFFTILTTKSPTYQHPQEKTSSSPYKASLSCTEKLQNKLSKADMFGLRKRGSVDECTTRPLQKRRRTEANSRTKSEISLPTNTVGEEVKADEVFLVSPFNKTRDPSQNLDMKGVTPRHNMKQNYTPPSALSLLHLTTSPVVLRETNYMSDCKKDHETGTCKARRSLCNKLHR